MHSARRVGGRRGPRAHRPSVLALEGRTLLAASPRIDEFAVPTYSASATHHASTKPAHVAPAQKHPANPKRPIKPHGAK